MPFSQQCPGPGKPPSPTLDTSAGWDTPGPQPYTGPHLTGGFTDTEAETTGIEKWDLTGRPSTLVAVATATGAVRGGTVTLDGSRSRTNITSYKWALAPGLDCDGAEIDSRSDLSGATLSFTALCSFSATLTVSDGQDTATSAPVLVRVRPRPWKTPFKQTKPGLLNSKLVDGFLQFGRNVCTLDGLEGEQRSGHIVHRGGGPITRAGFTVAQVSDGPFRGDWYVTAYTAEVARTPLISRDLYPGSDLYAENTGPRRADLLALRTSVIHHETLHGELIKEALGNDDPAKTVEALIGSDEEQVADQANLKLVALETTLENATSDKNVKQRMPASDNRPADIYIRTGVSNPKFRLYHITSLAQLGADGQP